MMLSPVWIPMGSKFSTVQMMTTLSFMSRNNSNSNSFQPNTAFSTNTSWVGEAFKPRRRAASNSSSLCTKPPPVPPSVYEGRITKGKPIFCAASLPSKKELAIKEGATSNPMSIMCRRKASRFSVNSMAAMSTPIMRTPYFSQTPSLSASIARFKAVCPPMVGNTASILRSSKICTMLSTVSGNK